MNKKTIKKQKKVSSLSNRSVSQKIFPDIGEAVFVDPPRPRFNLTNSRLNFSTPVRSGSKDRHFRDCRGHSNIPCQHRKPPPLRELQIRFNGFKRFNLPP